MKYRNHDLDGFLLVDKPLGLTSMEVVRQVRRAGGHCKTGHAGTLDPLATGLIICCLGKATREVEALMGQAKVYETSIDLSAFSTTDDAEGQKEPVEAQRTPEDGQILTVLWELTGVVMQRPPAYSAIKVDGKRAYDMARAGQTVELKERPVRIDGIELLSFEWPLLRIRVSCGRGTYIRSLARQIGEKLGTGGYLTELRRLSIGKYEVGRAWKLGELPQPLGREHLEAVMGEPATGQT